MLISVKTFNGQWRFRWAFVVISYCRHRELPVYNVLVADCIGGRPTCTVPHNEYNAVGISESRLWEQLKLWVCRICLAVSIPISWHDRAQADRRFNTVYRCAVKVPIRGLLRVLLHFVIGLPDIWFITLLITVPFVVSESTVNSGALDTSAVWWVNRLDQTLGKPGAWMVTTDNEKQRLTVVVRLSRLESQARTTLSVTIGPMLCLHCSLGQCSMHITGGKSPPSGNYAK